MSRRRFDPGAFVSLAYLRRLRVLWFSLGVFAGVGAALAGVVLGLQ